jgi:hypothetical protein
MSRFRSSVRIAPLLGAFIFALSLPAHAQPTPEAVTRQWLDAFNAGDMAKAGALNSSSGTSIIDEFALYTWTGPKAFAEWGDLTAMMLVVSAPGQDYKPLIGKWSMTSETSEDPVQWTLTLKESGGKLTASVDTGEGEQPAKDFTYTDGIMKFKAPYQDVDYDIELTANADKLNGTWSGGGDSGKTSGTKIPAE